MALLVFCGDIHGKLLDMYGYLLQWENRIGKKIDAVVQVGDFGIFSTLGDFPLYWEGKEVAPIPTWCIAGNHESPTLIRDWQNDSRRMENLRLLPDGHVTNVCGVRVASVWGNYSPRSWERPSRVLENRGTSRKPEIAMHVNRWAVEGLLDSGLKCGDIDVLVTHDSARLTLPLKFSHGMDPDIKGILGLEYDEESGGCKGFDELIKKFEPPHYFFGHLHEHWEGRLWNTNWACLSAIHYAGDWAKFVEFPDDGALWNSHGKGKEGGWDHPAIALQGAA